MGTIASIVAARTAAMSQDELIYALEPRLGVEEFTVLLRRSPLADRRPLHEPERLARMLAAADLIVTARRPGGTLIGVARTLTDFAYCCYIADLAIDRDHARRGVDQELIRRTHEAAGPGTTLVLLS
jgi:hypothetical protein